MRTHTSSALSLTPTNSAVGTQRAASFFGGLRLSPDAFQVGDVVKDTQLLPVDEQNRTPRQVSKRWRIVERKPPVGTRPTFIIEDQDTGKRENRTFNGLTMYAVERKELVQA